MRSPIIAHMTMLAIVGLGAAACKPKASVDSNSTSAAHDSGLRFVAPKDGLNMREEPSVTGKKMLTIPKGAQVQKLEEKPESFKIDNIEGKWTKISWQGKTGWVFGGFLSTWKPYSPFDSAGPEDASSAVESSAHNDSACKDKCQREVSMESTVCEACGRSGVVCVPVEVERCLAKASKKYEACVSNCS